MQIPVENIYYLLCYAWDKLDEDKLVSVKTEGCTQILDLLSRVLASGCSHLFKRGFDRSYICFEEETRRLRGRILFAPTLQRNLLQRGEALCEMDDLSHDVLHNRILKSTLTRLLRCGALESAAHDRVARVCRRFPPVREIELSAEVFRRARLHRSSAFYDFLLRICEFIYENLLPGERPGTSRMRDFLRDEVKMRGVFENFVRNFYKRHLVSPDKCCGGEVIKWQFTPLSKTQVEWLPIMRTDISLEASGRKFVIDCKYTEPLPLGNRGARKFASGHLYQIHTYISQLPTGTVNANCISMLLYPVVGGDFKQADYRDDSNGHEFRIRTINLGQQWKGIEHDLLELVRQ
jgi:McrBC 5-methylcytosine restriction system component